MPDKTASFSRLLRIRDVLAKAEAAERVAYIELRIPGARERWLQASAARVDFDVMILAPARVDIDFEKLDSIAPTTTPYRPRQPS